MPKSSCEIDEICYEDPLFDSQSNLSDSVVVVEHIPARVISSAEKKLSFRQPFFPVRNSLQFFFEVFNI